MQYSAAASETWRHYELGNTTDDYVDLAMRRQEHAFKTQAQHRFPLKKRRSLS